jgi:hypothetical protein
MSNKQHLQTFYNEARKRVPVLWDEGLQIKVIGKRLKVSEAFVQKVLHEHRYGKQFDSPRNPIIDKVSAAVQRKIGEIKILEDKLFNQLIPEIRAAEKRNAYNPRMDGDYKLLCARYAYMRIY